MPSAGQLVQLSYSNPMYLRDSPDIGVLRRPEGYYAYDSQGQTAGGMHNIQSAFSPDLVAWQPRPDALPVKAAWAPDQDYWAPDVVALTDDEYRTFFNALVRRVQSAEHPGLRTLQSGLCSQSSFLSTVIKSAWH